MPEAMPFELRIYCLCGQKMKVTSDMLGKPGKCIACRQKIRIPGEDELGPDEVVIHLKDHPEYLRKPQRSGDAASLPEDSMSDLERDDVILEADSGQLAAVAFERFEPIRRLCNYEHKVKRELQNIREGRPAALDKATLMSYRGLARQSRQQLEAGIREELIAIGAELRENREEIEARQVGLCAGDMEHITYSKAVLPLRRRREVLVYRQQNLRGWLASEDPHTAGGLDDVALADVPVDLVPERFPLAEEIEGLPIENAVSRLERALRERETTDKLLNQLHKMGLDGVVAVDELSRRKADAEADRQRSRTAIAFYRGRLEQVIQDCEEDSNALKAYETVMREQLASAAIAMDVFKKLEEAIFRAQVDIKRARNLANRALHANDVSDVPNPHGTFLERLARPGTLRGLGADSWFAWAGSALLLVSLFVPLATQSAGGPGLHLDGRAAAYFSVAAVASLSAAIVFRVIRGALLNLIWLLFTLGGAYFLRGITAGGQEALSPEYVSWFALENMLILGSWVLLGVAAVVSFFSLGHIRWVALATIAAGLAASVFMLGDFVSAENPEPLIAQPAIQVDAFTGTYAVRIPIRNGGGEAFVLGDDGGEGGRVAGYLLEYKIGANSWADAGAPLRVTSGGKEVGSEQARDLSIAPDGQVELHYKLAPGIYRVQLTPAWDSALPVRHTFQLQPPDPAETRAADEEVMPAPVLEQGVAESVDIELKGVLDGEDTGPIFSIILAEPGKEERKEQFQLGDKVFGEWEISEFSPSHTTITVINGDRLIIVERGKRETLD